MIPLPPPGTDIGKCFVLSFIRQQMQQLFQPLSRIGMQIGMHPARPSLIIRKRVSVRISRAVIYFGSGYSVHKHFYYIAVRHRRRFHSRPDTALICTVINPILIMVPVPPFVMQPCRRVTDRLPFRIVRTAIALKIPGSHDKFRGQIFGQIMQQSLPVQSDRKTAFHYKILMIRNRFQMFPCMH